MDYTVVAHPRLKRDYRGRTVRTLVDMKNGWGIVPSGAVATVTSQGPKGSELLIERCTCCGLRALISGAQPTDIEFIEKSAAPTAVSSRP